MEMKMKREKRKKNQFEFVLNEQEIQLFFLISFCTFIKIR